MLISIITILAIIFSLRINVIYGTKLVPNWIIVVSLLCYIEIVGGYSGLFLATTMCEGVEDLPSIIEFHNLHLTETLKEARELLKEISGVYCFYHNETGTIYIGGSTNLGNRMTAHILNHSSNLHIQRAITLYGLPAFTFIIIEFCNPQEVTTREQWYLDWLFSLPSNLRYNFNPIAGMPPSSLGKTREGQRGSNHPNYGQVAFNAVGVSVLNLEGDLLTTFPSQTIAAKWLSITQQNLSRAIKRGYIVKGLYRVISNK